VQIVYFPYLKLGKTEEIRFGDIVVWNFGAKKNKYILDKEIRNMVEQLVSSNYIGKKMVKDAGIVSIGETDFRQFDETEIKLINDLKLILFLSFSAKNNVLKQDANSGLFMATSENFEPVYQNFKRGMTTFSEKTGYVVEKTVSGLEIGKEKFEAPRCLLTPFRFEIDEEFKSSLFWLKKKQKRLFEQIMRATNLFFESFYNTHQLNKNARILLQVGAFETLLDFKNRKEFKDKIEKYACGSNEKKRRYYYEKVPGKNKELEYRTLNGIWADKFYTLRNHIIHGQNIKPKEFLFKNKQRHTDIAILFFLLCIKRLINEKKRERLFFDEIKWEKWDDGMGNAQDGFVYDINVFGKAFADVCKRLNG